MRVQWIANAIQKNSPARIVTEEFLPIDEVYRAPRPRRPKTLLILDVSLGRGSLGARHTSGSHHVPTTPGKKMWVKDSRPGEGRE